MTKDGNIPQDQQLAEDIAEDMADSVDAFTAELEQLRAERDELKERFIRVLADAENARKRGERDRREAEQYGGSRLAR
ncbi:MAG: nucleotide exchange factor GrpE, partial [Rhodobacter sp.]|nr:nucleotide exchange factor GrpE [Rhodobacter sp.]